ncbi:MAG: putative DNA-binding domain-containing protein [Fibrobacteres bacterium]|nr:putative DNA-binding domain-containing protein [Fibrobacterota bacterium]
MAQNREPENPPSLSLAALQAWFGSAIANPLPKRYGENPLAVSSPGLAESAAERLRSKGDLGGFDRLGVYNEQYWFRLVTVMQSDYTAAIHLMGLQEFNDWAVRYLQAHPPASPFLADLDAGFPGFLAAGYAGPLRDTVLQAIAYERALSKAFDAPDGATLAAAGLGPEALMAERLRLAPHVTPLHTDWDFAEYRGRCLADESLEATMDPPLRVSADLVVHREADLRVMKTEVPAAALALLRAFPGTLPEVFARLDGVLAPSDQALLEREVSGWFRDWAAEGWLCLDRESAE